MRVNPASSGFRLSSKNGLLKATDSDVTNAPTLHDWVILNVPHIIRESRGLTEMVLSAICHTNYIRRREGLSYIYKRKRNPRKVYDAKVK